MNLVEDKVITHFGQERLSEVLEILSDYGKESHEKEVDRVQLGMIKLSDGNIEYLKQYLISAKQDYRNILAYAEYPEQMRNDTWRSGSDKKEKKRIIERDREQYEQWLKK